MKERLLLMVLLLLIGIVLIALNAISYTPPHNTADSEVFPQRSTYNVGPTGTHALFTLLTETGLAPIRWQQPPAALLTAGRASPEVLVMIGPYRRDIADAEVPRILQWVSGGGRLVLVDRSPPHELIRNFSSCGLKVGGASTSGLTESDPSVREQMVGASAAAKPVQPTWLARNVNSAQPSKFAAAITLEGGKPEAGDGNADPYQIAPLVHYMAGERAIVAEVPHGAGTIVFVSDPYMFSNGGLGLADNAQLALNLAEASPGRVAFDEYHHGYGSDRNRFLQFFAGTPVVAIFLQVGLILGLVFYSRSRRFGRPIVEREEDRLSKREYIGAMAELQQRTRAFDLATENIYREFRRRIDRSLGIRSTLSAREASRAIVDRTKADAATIERTLHACEEVIRGEPTNSKQLIELVDALRTIEAVLGIKKTVSRGRR